MDGGGSRPVDILFLSGELDGVVSGDEFGIFSSAMLKEFPGLLTFLGGEIDRDLSKEEFGILWTKPQAGVETAP